MNINSLRNQKFSLRKRLLLMLCGLSIICVTFSYVWFSFAEWPAKPYVRVTINGETSSNVRVYESPKDQRLLVVLNSKSDKVLYIIDVAHKRMGTADPYEFYTIRDTFALPNVALPSYDPMPSEAFSYPNPYLLITRDNVSFCSFKRLRVNILLSPK